METEIFFIMDQNVNSVCRIIRQHKNLKRVLKILFANIYRINIIDFVILEMCEV